MQGTFLDAVNTGKNPTKAAKFLKEIDKVVPWYRINNILKKWKDSDLGRKGYRPETMFRMSLLKDFYGLSDLETEEMINDRISFRKFSGWNVGMFIFCYSLCRLIVQQK